MWRSLNLAVTSLHKIFHRLLQNYSINAFMFYQNMENIYSSYSGLFTQYRTDYLDYQITVPSLLGELNNNLSR
jgi:hypothetical protein